jgi:hypothetical protein
MYLDLGDGMVVHRTKLRFIKDFDGWKVDEAQVEFTPPFADPSWTDIHDFAWGGKYLNYLLSGK